MVVIGVPVPKDYSIDVRTASYCAAEAMRPGVKWGYVASREAGVGRSSFAHHALKDPDVTHLYFMDYDVEPPVGTLQKLLNHHLPIVAGVIPLLVYNEPRWSFKINGSQFKLKSEDLPTGLTEVTALGGSTLLVEREVIENIEPPCFKIVYKAIDENGQCYDECEDEYFSRVAREAGYKLIIDPTIICKHYNYKEL